MTSCSVRQSVPLLATLTMTPSNLVLESLGSSQPGSGFRAPLRSVSVCRLRGSSLSPCFCYDRPPRLCPGPFDLLTCVSVSLCISDSLFSLDFGLLSLLSRSRPKILKWAPVPLRTGPRLTRSRKPGSDSRENSSGTKESLLGEAVPSRHRGPPR